MEQIAKALELKMELDTLRPIDKEQEAVIMQKLRLDWDYHSNHLEGNTLTYGETKALILFGITAQGKPLQDHLELTGHDEAIKWVTEIVKGDYPLTEKFIRELHILLLKEPYDVDAITPDGNPTRKRIEIGKYKSIPNHVKTKTGEIFRFATPEETPAMMQELIEWYRQKKEKQDTNPVILAAEFHYKFIRIHPFDDGNGRIARILMNFILMENGYPPAVIKTDDKGNYFAALQQADSGIYEPFFDYIAKNVVRSLEIMIAGAKGESIEEPDDLDKEIALLELRFKSIGRNIEVTKSKDSMRDIYENSFISLIESFIDANQKFDRFYVNNFIELGIGNNFNSVDYNRISSKAPLRDYKSRIDENVKQIKILYTHNTLRQLGFETFEIKNSIGIEFLTTKYRINALGNKFEEKLYSEQLTDNEISSIIKKIALVNKVSLEEKIKEIQNKKD